MNLKVFISYSHADSKFVNDLANKLKVSGVDVWIDKWKIKVGNLITQKINEGIGESDFLIIVLSQTSVKSIWVREELNSALIRNIEAEKHAFILPVLKEDCEIPPLLQHRKYANFKDDPEMGFQELIEVVSPYKDFEPEMVLIPAGDFLMGSDPKKDSYAQDDEIPQHRVFVSEFYIGKYPVTNKQYKAFLDATGHTHTPRERFYQYIVWKHKLDHPMVGISWGDAITYCMWLAEFTGKPYRLPTEAEWEKMARGTDGRRFPWVNNLMMRSMCCNTYESRIGDTTVVGKYSPRGDSPYGVADIAGNVWEWCSSLKKPYPYDANDGREDLKASGGRVLRGGAFSLNSNLARCAYRLRVVPISRATTRFSGGVLPHLTLDSDHSDLWNSESIFNNNQFNFLETPIINKFARRFYISPLKRDMQKIQS